MFVFVACNPPPPPNNCFGIHFDYSLFLKVQNEFGENLLNEQHPNYIDIDSVNLYGIAKDGCEVFLYDKYADISKGFRVWGSGDNAMLQIVLEGNGLCAFHYHGSTKIEEYEYFHPEKIADCTLLLKWNSQNTDTDTIYTTFVHLNSTAENPLPNGYCKMHLYNKIYYNGELIVSSWEDNMEKMSQGIYPTIIK